MSKRDGWCIWSPWSGYFITTMATTRRDSIAAFGTFTTGSWRNHRRRGFQCRPVRLVSTALDDAMQREGE